MMEETPFETIVRLVSDLTGEDPKDLSEDTAIQDLGVDDEEYRRLFTEAAEAHDVDISDIINTMPIYRTADDSLLWSLRLISAFSPRAQAVLKDNTTKLEIDTLGSMAKSVEAARFVTSGFQTPYLDESMSKLGSCIWIAILAVPFLIGAYVTLGFAGRSCGICPRYPSDQFVPVLIGAGASLLFLAGAFWPGMSELRRVKARDAERARKAKDREIK